MNNRHNRGYLTGDRITLFALTLLFLISTGWPQWATYAVFGVIVVVGLIQYAIDYYMWRTEDFWNTQL